MNKDISIYTYKDYVTYLDDLLKARREENISYSQSEFAQDIGVSAPRISQILKRKEGISVKKAKGIVELLDFSEKESEYFFHLVSARTAKSPQQKASSEKYIFENYKKKIPLYLNPENWSLLDYEGWDIVWNFLAFSSDFRDLDKLSKVIQINSSEILII